MNLGGFLAQLMVLFTSTNPSPQTIRVQDRIGYSKAKPFTVLIEGNVGSGKSTTLSYFQSRQSRARDVDIVFEPVNLWRNISGVDLLDRIFTDTKRWALAFQSYSSLTRYRNTFKPTDKRYRIMERSIFSERACFLDTLHEQKNGMSDVEFAIMDQWYQLMTTSFWHELKPDLIVYVRCSVDVLLNRIKQRGRPEEADISREFVENIQRRHEDWLIHRNSTFQPPAPVLVLDGNLELDKFIELVKSKEDEIFGQSG